MKNLFNKLVLCAALLLVSFSAKAVESTVTQVGNGSNSLFGVSGRVQSIQVANNTASALTTIFYDSPSNTFYYSLGAYTNYISYMTNIVTVITLQSGVLQTNTNTGVFTVAQTVGASTPAYRTVAVINVAASSTYTYYPTNGLLVAFGLGFTNNTGTTVTATWTPSK